MNPWRHDLTERGLVRDRRCLGNVSRQMRRIRLLLIFFILIILKINNFFISSIFHSYLNVFLFDSQPYLTYACFFFLSLSDFYVFSCLRLNYISYTTFRFFSSLCVSVYEYVISWVFDDKQHTCFFSAFLLCLLVFNDILLCSGLFCC